MNPIQRLSVWFLVVLSFLPGLSPLEFNFGFVVFPGVIWMVVLPIAAYLVALNLICGGQLHPPFPAWPWMVWCIFVWASLLWANDVDHVGLREAMKLSLPIVLAVLASYAISSSQDLRWLFAALGVSLVFLLGFAIAYALEAFEKDWMELLVRESALSATFIGSAFLAFFPRRKALALTGWGTALMVATLTSSRMAALSLLVILVVHPYGWGHWLRKLSLVATCAAVGWFIFNTNTFQEHFFKSGQGTIADVAGGEFQGLGRFEVWPQVWDVAWERPWFGFGVGSIHSIVPLLWKNMISIHNDYLRVFYELGAVGFALTAVVCAWQLLALERRIKSRDDDLVRTAFSAGWLGFWAMLVSCCTDNTMAYVMYVNPLFVVIGAAYGAARVDCREQVAIKIAKRHNHEVMQDSLAGYLVSRTEGS